METLKTYKFYNAKLQRLAIFAEQVGDHLEITVIPCSKRDQFSRKVANGLYITTLISPDETAPQHETFSVPIIDGKPKFTFLAFCKDNYVRKFINVVEFEDDILDYKIIKSSTGFQIETYS